MLPVNKRNTVNANGIKDEPVFPTGMLLEDIDFASLLPPSEFKFELFALLTVSSNTRWLFPSYGEGELESIAPDAVKAFRHTVKFFHTLCICINPVKPSLLM